MRTFLVLLVIFVSSCGYTTRGFIYPESSIIIKPVVNKIDITAESRKYSDYVSFPILIENKLTNELVSKFNSEGNLKVVSQDPKALQLTCAVEGYDRETLRYTESDAVSEQRLRLRVHMKLTSGDGKVLQDKVVLGETTYYLTGANQKSESAAQLDLIDDTARRISEAVTEEW
ncbi:MAG: LPS assembly lipoprotein LptE [Candidatus Omnitrophota bacterium]